MSDMVSVDISRFVAGRHYETAYMFEECVDADVGKNIKCPRGFISGSVATFHALCIGPVYPPVCPPFLRKPDSYSTSVFTCGSTISICLCLCIMLDVLAKSL